jgi:hypothetical protein
MSAAVRVVVEVDGPDAYLRGPGSVVCPAIRAARAWRRYDERHRAIKVKTANLDDVLAAVQFQSGGEVVIERAA